MTSSASPSHPDPANRLERALGITVRGIVVLALWGLLPLLAATLLNRRRDARAAAPARSADPAVTAP